jgi:hypothetical protein
MKVREALKHPGGEWAVVELAIEKIRESLFGGEAKPPVADLVRLLEFRRDLAQAQPGPLTARWIDECQQTSDSGE